VAAKQTRSEWRADARVRQAQEKGGDGAVSGVLRLRRLPAPGLGHAHSGSLHGALYSSVSHCPVYNCAGRSGKNTQRSDKVFQNENSRSRARTCRLFVPAARRLGLPDMMHTRV